MNLNPINQSTPYRINNLKPSINDLFFSSIRGLIIVNSGVTSRPEDPEDSEEYLSKLDLALQYINGIIAISPRHVAGRPYEAKYKNSAETAFELKEALQIVYKLYRKHYSSIQQEDMNIVPGVGETAKEKINTLMSSMIRFCGFLAYNQGISIFGPELRDDGACIKDIVGELLIFLIESFNFDTNYLTVNVFYEISEN